MISIKVGGLEDLDRMLGELPQKVEKKVLGNAVTSSIRVAARDIRKNVPVGIKPSPSSKKYKSYRRNIRVKRLKRVARNERAARVTTGSAFWGYIYEKGSRYQPARPVFGPTFENAEERMIKELGKRIGEGVVKEAKRYRL